MDFSHMFQGSSINNLDLSSFNTKNVSNISYMFSDCKYLESVNLSCFINNKKLKNMSHLFSGCSNLKSINLSYFNI